MAIKTRDDLSMAYTPGVARVSQPIAADPESGWAPDHPRPYQARTSPSGLPCLGLGDIGPLAAMPVMKGKTMLFKDSPASTPSPCASNTTDVDEIVKLVQQIAPTFGGINLEGTRRRAVSRSSDV